MFDAFAPFTRICLAKNLERPSSWYIVPDRSNQILLFQDRGDKNYSPS